LRELSIVDAEERGAKGAMDLERRNLLKPVVRPASLRAELEKGVEDSLEGRRDWLRRRGGLFVSTEDELIAAGS